MFYTKYNLLAADRMLLSPTLKTILNHSCPLSMYAFSSEILQLWEFKTFEQYHLCENKTKNKS